MPLLLLAEVADQQVHLCLFQRCRILLRPVYSDVEDWESVDQLPTEDAVFVVALVVVQSLCGEEHIHSQAVGVDTIACADDREVQALVDVEVEAGHDIDSLLVVGYEIVKARI